MDDSLSLLIETMYATVLDRALWTQALGSIAEKCGGVGSVIVPLSDQPGPGLIASRSLAEPVRDYLDEEWWKLNSRVARCRVLGVKCGRVSDRTLFAGQDLTRDPFHQDFLRPRDFGSFVGHVMTTPDGRSFSLNVQKALSRGPFQSAEIASFDLLSRHAARAFSAAAALEKQDLLAMLASPDRDERSKGLVALDGNGAVLQANAAARAHFGRALKVENGQLVAARTSDRPKLARAIGAALAAGGLETDPVVALSSTGRGRPDLLVEIIPVSQACSDFSSFVFGAQALVFISDLEAPDTANVEGCLVALGLTKGQARIACSVGGGQSPNDVAKDLGLAETTVRSVLKQIYDRLGISSQSQLAVLATKLRSRR